ncbi:C-terminal binding protein [Aminiphilus sp.]|uniref:C-terminal binding protein n=1 Tax=Aminiphilus sp. TaxID=1872488 RepID=UPI00262EBA28|nr:C-terminal binding protein [Aminiphilus sp.]
MAKFKIFMTDKTWPDTTIEEKIIRDGLDAELILSRGGTPEEICREGRDCDALMVLFTPMGREYLEHFERCRLLVRMGIGTNTVDLPTATKKGIMVCNVPDYCQEEVADHVLALFLEITRKVGLLDRQVKSGGWDMTVADPVPRLQGKTFGLLGCGGIGRMTGRRAASFGMRLLGYDPFVPEETFRAEGIERRTDLRTFLSEADVVSLHVPLTPETEGIINRETLACMKRSAYLINTARGALIADDDLHEALTSGIIAGAALDVLREEPPRGIPRLLTLPNLVITPHAAWNSDAAIPELRVKAAEEVVRFFREGRPRNLVNREVLSALRERTAS